MVLLYKQTTLLDYAAGKAYVSLPHAYVSLLNAYVSLLHACLLRNAKGNSSFVKDKQTVSAFKNIKKTMECAQSMMIEINLFSMF